VEQLTVETAASLISSVGFPIFVACWLLFRTDKYMREMGETLRELLMYLKMKNGK